MKEHLLLLLPASLLSVIYSLRMDEMMMVMMTPSAKSMSMQS